MKLLIVDDEPLIHKSIDYCFHELQVQDVTLYHAYNCSDMLRQLEEQAMDGALVDIRMPGPNGLLAIQSAKERWPETEYYIMSGFSEFEYAREAVHLGVTEYLIKPLSPEDLSRVIDDIRAKQQEKTGRIQESFRTWLVGGLHRHDVAYLYTPGYYVGIALLTYDWAEEGNSFWIPDFGPLREHVVSLPCDEGLLLLAVSSAPAPVRAFLHQFPKKGLPRGVTVFVSSLCSDSASALTEMGRRLGIAAGRLLCPGRPGLRHAAPADPPGPEGAGGPSCSSGWGIFGPFSGSSRPGQPGRDSGGPSGGGAVPSPQPQAGRPHRRCPQLHGAPLLRGAVHRGGGRHV